MVQLFWRSRKTKTSYLFSCFLFIFYSLPNRFLLITYSLIHSKDAMKHKSLGVLQPFVSNRHAAWLSMNQITSLLTMARGKLCGTIMLSMASHGVICWWRSLNNASTSGGSKDAAIPTGACRAAASKATKPIPASVSAPGSNEASEYICTGGRAVPKILTCRGKTKLANNE